MSHSARPRGIPPVDQAPTGADHARPDPRRPDPGGGRPHADPPGPPEPTSSPRHAIPTPVTGQPRGAAHPTPGAAHPTTGAGTGPAACSDPGDPALLAAAPAGLAAVGQLVTDLTRETATVLRHRGGPLPATTPDALTRLFDARLPDGLLPRTGGGPDAVLDLARTYAEGAVDLADPKAAAHLQPPALTVAAAVDVLAGALNASVDTWDSGPSAVEVERRLVRELAALAGYGDAADGVLTPGGSTSNLQALLVARDTALAPKVAVRRRGLAGVRGAPVVFCSTLAHFSIARACALLGLGEDAVRAVPVDAHHRMRPDALDAALTACGQTEWPVAVVATAGTTDFGSVDPLPELAAIAARHRVHLHVDAAYGGGALFSERLRPLLAGLDRADTVTLDLHKTAWQPAASSVLLARDGRRLTRATGGRVAYLNPDDDGDAGYDGLLGQSLQTTRRADALRTAATFLALGRDGVGALLDTCHDLARRAERAVTAHPRLELTAGATLTTVVFRYLPRDPARADAVNAALRRRLLRSGQALVGRTHVAAPPAPGETAVPGGTARPGDTTGHGGVRLKLTLLNPQARPCDIDALVARVVAAGTAVENDEEHVDVP